jgi:trk system potassium uptake protein TrkH
MNLRGQRKAILMVFGFWIILIVVLAIPYYFADKNLNIFDSIFESVSALTTTEFTAIPDFFDAPKALLFYRGAMTWIGGIGVIIFMTALIAAFGSGGSAALKAEVLKTETTAVSLSNISSSLAGIVRIFAVLYLSFTMLCFVLLSIGGMSPFYALMYSLSSISTGGIPINEGGIAALGNVYFEMVVIAFCLLGSLNYLVLASAAKNGFSVIIKSPEIKAFFTIFFAATIAIAGLLFTAGSAAAPSSPLASIHEALRAAASFMTTSGFISSDYEIWPAGAKLILFLLLFVGGCSYSTSSSIKVIRVMTIFAILKRCVKKKLHPAAVVPVRIGKNVVSAKVASDVTVFVFLYLIIFAVGAVLLSFEGISFSQAVSASVAAISNVGLGFGGVNETEFVLTLSYFGKTVLMGLMLIGRLEIFTIILVFVPGFWRRG